MGHSVFGGMQRLNIEAARRQAGQELLQTPNPGLLPQSAGGGGTPISLSTPDILNSLIAITNPFFESTPTSSENATHGCSTMEAEEPQEKKVFANLDTPAATAAAAAKAIASTLALTNAPSFSSTYTFAQPPSISLINNNSIVVSQPQQSTSSSVIIVQQSQPPQQPLQLSPQTPVTSVQSMRSQLIKEGLKLTIQTKRKISGKGELDVKSELVAKRPKREEVELTSLVDFCISNDSMESFISQPTKLTAEDEERRRRRRERNKVAATKCRNKKKEKTFLLVKESEVLDNENIAMKSEIAKLEAECQRLSALLASHAPNCLMNLQPHQNSKPAVSTSHINNNNTLASNNGSSHHSHNNHSNAIIEGGMPYIATATTIPTSEDDSKYANPHFTSINNNHHHHHNQHNHNNNHFAGGNSSSMGMKFDYFTQINYNQPIQLS